MRTTRAALFCAAAVIGSMVLGMAPASAIGEESGDDTPPPIAETVDYGGPKSGTAGNCSVVSSPSYLGLTCGTLSIGEIQTIAQVLGDDPVPDCWHEPLSARELEELGRENTPGPEGSTWYWERCMTGIDPDTKQQTGPIEFTTGLISLRNDREPTTLTRRQQRLVDFNDGGSGGVPDPVAVTSPTVRPRVLSWVSFFNKQKYAGSDDHVGDTVTVAAGGVVLRARLTRTEVFPRGFGNEPTLSCPGDGVLADRDDTPQSRPAGCWYQYEQSSSNQTETSDGLPAYPVDIRANWVVELSVAGGPFTEFNRFSKSSRSPVAVTEVQAIVVN